MGHGYGGAVEHLGDAHGGALDVVHTVVEIVHLPAAIEFAPHCIREDAPVVLHDEGLHRKSVLRRFLYRGHVAYAREGHVQRPRYRRG